MPRGFLLTRCHLLPPASTTLYVMSMKQPLTMQADQIAARVGRILSGQHLGLGRDLLCR